MADFLTIAELKKITSAIPKNAADDAELKIVVNEENIILKDMNTHTVIAWVKRTPQPFWHSISAS